MHEETAGDAGRGAGGARPEGARAGLGGAPVTGAPSAGCGAPPAAPAAGPGPLGPAASADQHAAEAAADRGADHAARADADQYPDERFARDGFAAEPVPVKLPAPEPDGQLPESEVFIEIPADRLYVVLARSAAVHLGSVLHLGITDVTDLRLAVDEACALFLLHPAFPDGRDA